MKKTFKKGQIIYCDGEFRCRVVEDYGDSVAYIPLEGYAPGQKGRTFNAGKELFSEKQVERPKKK